MKLRSAINIAERFIIDNSPTLLSGIAVTGTIGVAYLTGKATFKAAELIGQELNERDLREQNPPFETKDMVKLVWKCYIPPALLVVGTGVCIVAANHINARRMAALAAAYKISEKQINEYKDKVLEKFGDKREAEVRSEIAQDLVMKNPPGEKIFNAFGSDTLCLDKWTGRYFYSDMQTIRAAENDINKGLFKGSERAVTLADFYENIGLQAPRCAEEVGWNADASMDLTFDTVMTPDGVPCLVVDFAIEPFPIRGYFGKP